MSSPSAGRLLSLALGLAVTVTSALSAATLTVTNTADSGAGSLRDAITQSNSSVGVLDTIAFAIPGAGPHTIAPASALPIITDPVVIDGSTQPGFAGMPLIELDGTNAVDGLTIDAGGSTVRGLVINRCSQAGISLSTAGSNTIVGNFIGTNAAGTADLGNTRGILVNFASSSNVIGGVTTAERNLVSGNNSDGIVLYTPNNQVLGNFVGTDVTGTVPIPNGYGVEDYEGPNAIGGSSGTTPGGPCTGACNLISGNVAYGVLLQSVGSGTTVQGNFIGTDVTGTAPLGNGNWGVLVTSPGSIVGGSAVGARNVISANFGGIAVNERPSTVIQGNFIGTNAAGTAALPNSFAGVHAGNVSTNTLIGGSVGVTPGGPCTGACNLISGNTGFGIAIGTGGSSIGESGDIIQGNCIGTQADCESPLGNGDEGINIGFEAVDTTVGGTASGEGNVIAHNGLNGVTVVDGTGNSIRGNSIFSNDGLGIDLSKPPLPALHGDGVTANDAGDPDVGANLLQNFPIVSTVTYNAASLTEGATIRIQGVLRSAPSTTYDLDLFSNSACAVRPQEFLEGRTYLGSTEISTDGSGFAAFDVTLPFSDTAGDPVSATATDPLGNTSEFSQRIVFSVAPVSGPASGGTSLVISGTDFAPGATVTIGGQAAGNVAVNSFNSISATSPALAPGTVNDLTVENPDGSAGTLPRAWVADFLDVPNGQQFHDFVTTLVRNGITVGIGQGLYGVNDPTLRQQMAVFLLKSKYGLCYQPPPCTGVFDDVPCSSSFAPWIEALAAEGITGGCGGDNYCPQNPVRRDQMAVFLLKTRNGSTYVPPDCAGVFDDVPCPDGFAVDWIEQLAAETITTGCGGGNYCPLNPITRGQMAVFLVRTFDLQ